MTKQSTGDLLRTVRAELAEVRAEIEARISEVRKEPRMRVLHTREAALRKHLTHLGARVLEELNAARVKAGTCRHCGGPLPCDTPWGDVRPGVRRG